MRRPGGVAVLVMCRVIHLLRLLAARNAKYGLATGAET
jgi:hypothetical protein